MLAGKLTEHLVMSSSWLLIGDQIVAATCRAWVGCGDAGLTRFQCRHFKRGS